MKEATNNDLDMLDGYEELSEDLQEKVRRAFEQGHVDDDDWRGVFVLLKSVCFLYIDASQDLEQNRPGASRSFRSPAVKKQKKAAEEAEAEVS